MDSGIPVSDRSTSPVLLYHKVDSKIELGITRTTPSGFKRQVESVSRLGYSVSSLSSLHDETGDSYNQHQYTHTQKAGLTFDDGYQSVFENALPVLIEHNYSATTFVPVNYIGRINTWDSGRFGLRFRHMTRDELNEWIAAGNEVGSHSLSHKHLALVDHHQRYAEIVDSRYRLEEITGSEIKWFSPPFGWYDRHVLELVQEAGYKGIAVIRKNTALDPLPGIFVQPRQPVYLGDNSLVMKHKLSGIGFGGRLERFRQLVIHSGSWGTVAVQAIKNQRKPWSSMG